MTTCSYHEGMRTVGIRDLKARLSEYIRRVREGEDVLITDRGVVVAELRPPRHLASEDPTERGLDDLARQGILRRATRSSEASLPTFSSAGPEGIARDLLDEERGP